MERKNVFTGGIVADIDKTHVQPNQLVFPTIGIRIFNKDGKGYIASCIPGNEEYFSITDDFVIIGGYEFQGIAFIFSFNETTGETEIGTYPSPNRTTPGFTNTYSPLNHFVRAGMIWPFRTALFNHELKRPLDIQMKLSYDNSMDIYLSDFVNPDRVINSGFKIDGTTNDRYVRDTYFNGLIDHIPTTKKIPVITSDVQNGGVLQPGHYFISLRYLTHDYGKTTFLREEGPINISIGDTMTTHTGLQDKNFVLNAELKSNRKIVLDLSNVDSDYSYIQLAITRYSSVTENAPAFKDIWLIDKYYPITGGSMQVHITGNEARQILTFDDIIRPSNPYKVSLSRTQIGNRMFRANLKKLQIVSNRQHLITLAQKITVGESIDKNYQFDRYLNEFMFEISAIGYADPEMVAKRVGHFKDQIYPFGIVYQFSDGTESEAFPVKGNLGDGTKGLYKFDSFRQVAVKNAGQASRNWISAVKFDILNARTYFNNYKDTYFKDVVGFYFVRGDRIENLITQGLLIHTYHGMNAMVNGDDRCVSFQGIPRADTGGEKTNEWNPQTAAQIPLLRGTLPTSKDQGRNASNDHFYGVSTDYHYTFDGANYPWDGGLGGSDAVGYTFPARLNWSGCGITNRGIFSSYDQFDHRHAIFSPDMLFETDMPYVDETTYVQPIFKFKSTTRRLTPFLHRAARTVHPNWDVLDLCEKTENGTCMTPFMDINFHKVNSVMVNHNQQKGKYNFCGYFANMGEETGVTIVSAFHNRNIGVSRYIGVQDIGPGYPMKDLYGSVDDEHLAVVNLYQRENNDAFFQDTESAFNVGTTFYGRISDTVDMRTSLGNTFIVYKGDCFINKTWFRSHRWYAIEDPDPNDEGDYPGEMGAFPLYRDRNGTWYQHGLMMGFVTEMKYNAGMRNEVPTIDADNRNFSYTFFPYCISRGIELVYFTVMQPDDYLQEAVQINKGYNVTMSDRRVKGFEPTEPDREEYKPNRVDATDEHILGAFIDGYRNIQIGTFQDYALEDGPIHYIGENMGMPFIVQRDAVNQIFLNERAVGSTDTGQMIITGASVLLFSPQTRKISNFGTQHKGSVVRTDQATYGYDFAKRVWWVTATYQSATGQNMLGAFDMGQKYLVSDEIKSIIDTYSDELLITQQLPDEPFLGSGIVGFHNPEFDEVGLTFLLPEVQRTLIFNEKVKQMRGDHPYAEGYYFTIGRRLVSQHHTVQNYQWRIGNKVYRYDVPVVAGGVSNYGIFFGEQKEIKVSFVVNGLDEKENLAGIMKVYNSLSIESRNEVFKQIIYQTQYQEGIYDFKGSLLKFWKAAEYNSHIWSMPVENQTSATVDQFQQGSEMRGYWMKVTIVFDGKKDFEMKSVKTDFTLIHD